MPVSRRKLLRSAMLAASIAILSDRGIAAPKVRIGVLKFGTVSWELDTLKHHGFDAANGIDLDVAWFAGEDATNVALLAGEIDIIVSDWLWVSRQRSEGDDLTLVPYSTAVGAIMATQGSSIRTIADLTDKKIGVAGGPLDKSWLLIQALARRDHDLDLSARSEIVFGAPPLLQEKAISGELDAVLNFWHFCARLETEGFRRVVGADDAARALGASGPVSALGYVFHEQWANDNRDAAAGFVRAVAQAKQMLAGSDEEWLRLAPIVRAEGRQLDTLRDRYRVLAEIGGSKLVGDAPEMAPGTFWAGAAR